MTSVDESVYGTKLCGTRLNVANQVNHPITVFGKSYYGNSPTIIDTVDCGEF